MNTCTLRETLLIDLITAGAGITLFAPVRFPKPNRKRERYSVWKEIGTGIRYAHTQTTVRQMLLLYGLFVFLTVPAGYLSGLLVSRIFGDTYWYLTAVELAGFGGMMAGGMLISLWGGFNSRRLTLSAGLALFGAMAIFLGVSRSFVLYLTLMALYGVALTSVQTTITTLLQEHSAPAMQGRVFGLMGSLYAICYPFGMVVFGPLADRLPLEGIMIFSGIGLMITAVWAYREA